MDMDFNLKNFENYEKDRNNIIDDASCAKNLKKESKINLKSDSKLNEIIEELKAFKNEKNDALGAGNGYKGDSIVVDFTEYNPLHNGHKYCMDFAKKFGIFICVVPGPLERSGRGIPYLLNREIRAKMAIKAGADLVVEGPPMGIMGSGQYVQCLIRMFYKLGGEVIPRGYIEEQTMNKVISCIIDGHHIKIKPYKISCIETGEVLGEKLEIDNYVIASMSYTIHKLRKVLNNYEPKFKFLERIEGISGTKIREGIYNGNFDILKNMVPDTTIEIIENLFKNYGMDEIILKRYEDRILDTVNNDKYDIRNIIPEKMANTIHSRSEHYESIEELKKALPYGFTKNSNDRTLTKLEARISSEDISNYIEYYPRNVKILENSLDYE
ncbi:nucleotidyltransferase family protein [Methanococcus voltae]|uniref:nucleotidyltransferase family protein n=1 Tax=Methanococcus voltae TaxID=2188 RepID=UPI003CCA2E88|nr:putative nucleotidyltransferase [Methanococcus voltae]